MRSELIMKKFWRKATAVVATVAMVASIGVPVFADTNKKVNFPESSILTSEIAATLTVDNFAECYEYLVEYSATHPNVSVEELDVVATGMLAELAKNNIETYGYNDDLVEAYNKLNKEELVLAMAYPTEASAIYHASKTANTATNSRYSAGKYLGNGDAFRHTAWNALAVGDLYGINIGDVNTCISKTKVWTDAHEHGAAAEPSLSSAQRSVDTNMDLFNNSVGRGIGEANYNKADSVVLDKVQFYVDNGSCKRVKTDAQIEYTLEQMAAISNWSLRATNTCGKN